MTDLPEIKSDPRLLFTQAEWDGAMPSLTQTLQEKLKRHRTPLFIDHGDHGDHGEAWGSGSFIEIRGRRYILTNQHVAEARGRLLQLGCRFDGQDGLPRIFGDHVEKARAWDLALLPVPDAAWTSLDHTSVPIREDQFALAHVPVQGEVFAFAGYAGTSTTFLFGEMHFGATTSLAREKLLTPHADVDERFHFGLDYAPDLATTVVGDRDLPLPPGFSGSTVWNTCFVEAKASGLEWAPDMAKVAGVVWGWPSSQGAIVATKVEHVRSFLLGATA